MLNQDLAKIFFEMAQYLEMEEGKSVNPFKVIALKKAAINLESLSEDVENIYKKGRLEALMELPGVGRGIAEKIVEFIKTGKIKENQQLKKKFPINIEELASIEGLGPKKIKILYQKLKIKNLEDLEAAVRAHKIASLFGFGKKTEKNIIDGIEFYKKDKGLFLLGEILPKAEEILEKLKSLKEVIAASLAGSTRRRKEMVKDVDFLVASDKSEKVMDFFVSLPGVVKIWGKGETKTSIRMSDGFDMDIRVVPKKSFGAALQYFTGSKEHNIALRKIAIEKGYKLSEYGLFDGEKIITGETESGIYEKLGLEWIPPELRENAGEVEAAHRQFQSKPNGLPKLVELKDIKGDLHCHSHWGEGRKVGLKIIEQYARLAMDRGYKYIGISDHTKFLHIEHGLDEKQLAEQRKEIDKLNSRFMIQDSRFRILQGCEANIMADGSIDISDEALAKLDYVIAGIHSQMRMTKKEMTERIIRAMKNSNVDIISHPTGRILKQREEYEIDFDEILKVSKETKTVLEINASPVRLDLNDKNIRKAKEMGVKVIINSDAHQKEQMNFMEYGVNQARRGWAEKGDIINCWPVEKMKSFFKNYKPKA